MPYAQTLWNNGTTPLSAAHLNNLETEYFESTNSFQQNLLQPFVFSGLAATKDGTVNNQLDVTAGVAFLIQTDNTVRYRSTSASTPGQFTTSAISAVYFLDLNPDGTWSFATSHSAQANYLSVAQVTTDASGNISTVTDERVTTINFFSGALATGMSINGNAVVTTAGGSLTLTQLTVTGSTGIAISGANGWLDVDVTLSASNRRVFRFVASDGHSYQFQINTDNSVRLMDNTSSTLLMEWTAAATAVTNCLEATGVASFGGGSYSLIATASNGAIYSDNGNFKTDGSGDVTATKFIPTASSPTSFNCRGNFSGTGSGTASHGAGTTPAWVGITDSQSSATMTVGAASYGATTVVVTTGASHTWKGVAI